MRHRIFGKQLSRSTNERQMLFRNLVRDLILHGKIRTSKAKAKAVQPIIESLITKVKKNTSGSSQKIKQFVTDRKIQKKLSERVSTQFASRTSGYTRILKLGLRRGDGAEEVMMEFVDPETVTSVVVPKKVSGRMPKADLPEKPVKKEPKAAAQKTAAKRKKTK